MAIQYLKKSPKTSSTDDTKTREIVENILRDIEKFEEGKFPRKLFIVKNRKI